MTVLIFILRSSKAKQQVFSWQKKGLHNNNNSSFYTLVIAWLEEMPRVKKGFRKLSQNFDLIFAKNKKRKLKHSMLTPNECDSVQNLFLDSFEKQPQTNQQYAGELLFPSIRTINEFSTLNTALGWSVLFSSLHLSVRAASLETNNDLKRSRMRWNYMHMMFLCVSLDFYLFCRRAK